MKVDKAIKYLTLSLFIVLSFVFPHKANAGDKGLLPIVSHNVLDVIEDGKLTEAKYKVRITIFDYYGNIYVTWECVFISPLHEEKKMLINPFSFTTGGGSITDVKIQKDHFSFKLELTAGRVIQIIGSKKPDSFDYSIEGVGFWWSDILKRNTRTEWRSTERKILLPYREAF